MRTFKLPFQALALFIFTLSLVAIADAQIGIPATPRTYVSVFGDDANPCSRSRPCRNFDAALTIVNAGGEVLALDDGMYNKTTITKSVTITAPPGVHAEIAPTAGNAITVNAGDGNTVVIRNLNLSSRGGTNAILFNGGQFATLHVENCVVNGFNGKGIGFSAAQGGRLFVKDTIVRNGGTGIDVGAGRASIDRCRVENGKFGGIVANNSAQVTVRDTISTGNRSGFTAREFGLMELESCQATHNNFGILTENGGVVLVSNSTILFNETDLESPLGGQIISYGGNTVSFGVEFNQTLEKK